MHLKFAKASRLGLWERRSSPSQRDATRHETKTPQARRLAVGGSGKRRHALKQQTVHTGPLLNQTKERYAQQPGVPAYTGACTHQGATHTPVTAGAGKCKVVQRLQTLRLSGPNLANRRRRDARNPSTDGRALIAGGGVWVALVHFKAVSSAHRRHLLEDSGQASAQSSFSSAGPNERGH